MTIRRTLALTPALALALTLGTETQAAILVDYDDGVAGGGHDAAVLAGDFTDQTNAIPAPWVNQGTENAQFQTSNSQGVGSTKNYVAAGIRVIAIDTGHTIAAGESYNLEFSWRDAAGWDDDDTVQLVLFYTIDNTIGGAATDIATLNSGGRVTNGTWETELVNGVALADGGAVGNTLFARIDSLAGATEYSRVDNIFVEAVPVPEPGSLALLGLGGLLIARRRR